MTRSLKTPPFPLVRIEPSWLPKKMVKYISDFFNEYGFDFDDFVYHATKAHVKRDWEQGHIVNLHEKLKEKGWIELWCLALLANGMEPYQQIKDARYEGGYLCVGTTALDIVIPETAFWHGDAQLHRLISVSAERLMKHAIEGFTAPKSRRFSFAHDTHIRALFALALNQQSPRAAEFTQAVCAPPKLCQAFTEAFALYGKPTQQVLTVAGAQLIEWQHDLKQEGNRLSRAFMSDFVECLVNCADYWILSGTPVVDAVGEVQHRLELLVPFLFPTRSAGAHKAHIRNQIGRLLARHPNAWGCFEFEAPELLGPSVLDHEDSRTEVSAYDDVLNGFLSRRHGLDFQKFAIKKFSKSHPEIRDPANVPRLGTRSSAWSSPDNNYEAIAQTLNLLREQDFYHPVLNGTTSIELLTEPNCLKILMEFLETGSQHSKNGAIRAIERFPSIIDTVLPTITTKSQAKRMASIHHMTAAQMATFSLQLRGAIFHTSLGL